MTKNINISSTQYSYIRSEIEAAVQEHVEKPIVPGYGGYPETDLECIECGAPNPNPHSDFCTTACQKSAHRAHSRSARSNKVEWDG